MPDLSAYSIVHSDPEDDTTPTVYLRHDGCDSPVPAARIGVELTEDTVTDLSTLLAMASAHERRYHRPALCGLPVGSKPSWMGVDQYDPCKCILPTDHEPPCKCSHQVRDSPTLRPPREWASLEGLRILDPDGWRGARAKDFEEPITRLEYEERVSISTVEHIRREPGGLD